MLVLLVLGGDCRNLTEVFEVSFEPGRIEKLHSEDSTKVRFWTSDLSDDDIEHGVVTIVSKDPGVAKACIFITKVILHIFVRIQYVGDYLLLTYVENCVRLSYILFITILPEK